MSENKPLVSVIMPCFNGMPYLNEAIDSVRAQQYSNWELIVIDNGSSDGSKECVTSHANADRRISLIECVQQGAGAARNLGIEKSSGRFIAFLDCDDLWKPAKLVTQITEMIRTDAAFSWTAYEVIDEAGSILRNQPASKSINYQNFMAKDCVIGCLTVVFDSGRLGKRFMPMLKMRQDYALWAEIIDGCERERIPMTGLTESLSKYRIHSTAMTRNKVKAAYFQWQLYRVARRHTIAQSSRYFARYLINAIRDRVN